MSELSLVDSRGVMRDAGAFVTNCAVSRDSSHAAFSTGDGMLHIAKLGEANAGWERVAAHDGSILALAAGLDANDFLTGGDDNRLCRVHASEPAPPRVHELSRGRRWVEQIASVRDGATAWIASAHGKQVELRNERGELVRCFTHDTTVSGIAFDLKGKRLAASHYGGVSFRFVNAKNDTPRLLTWKGSHIAVAVHPAAESVVTAMQENELHGWRLADGHHMRMSGYPQKTRSLSFSRNGRWLATSGADSVVLWPFFGGGPTGKTPKELTGLPGVTCTRVAFHPQHDIVAAGFADGTVLLADVGSARVLPVCESSGAAISALAFSPNGVTLAFGNEGGTMAGVDLAASKDRASGQNGDAKKS